MFTRKSSLRTVSLFVVITFVLSLGAPVIEAAQTASAVTASTMTQAATTGLSNLWLFWGEHIKTLKVTPTKEAAFTFFQSRGATASQATALTGNAEAAGHFASGMPAAAEATKTLFKTYFDKFKGVFGAKTVVQPAAATTTTGLPGFEGSAANSGLEATVTKTPVDSVKSGISSLSDKVRGFFSSFRSGSSAATSDVAATQASSSASSSSAANTVDAAAAGSVAAKTGLMSKVGTTLTNAKDSVVLATKRGASATGGAVKTGWLTLGDKLDFNRYYKIPVTDTIAIKTRGEWSSTTKFTENGWVQAKYDVTSKTPGSLTDAIGKVDAIAAKPAPTGFFGKAFAKFKDSVTSVKNKISGKGYTTEQTKMELQKLQIEGDLLEQSRMLNDTQRAIKYRIDDITGKANALQKPVPEKEIAALKKQYDAIENTKQKLQKDIAGVQDGATKTIVKDAAKWALYSIGITASVNIIKQVFSGDGIDLKAAFSFMVEPSFWGGTVGGFLGSTLLTTLAAGILPPGAGIFLQILPGFLGAALGFEMGSGLFGGQMDLLGAIVQTLASAGGYTLAMSMIGPGIPAILAAIAAGSLASMLLNKIRGGFQSEAYTLPPESIVPVPSDVQIEADEPEATPAAVKGPDAPSLSLGELQEQVSKSYQDYMNFLKLRKMADAQNAYKDYVAAKTALESVKSAATGN
jgi:hypothetical protein